MKLLFLDDERFPRSVTWPVLCVRDERIVSAMVDYEAQDCVVVRTNPEFSEWISRNGMPEQVSFDHDLGHGAPGGDAIVSARWLVVECVRQSRPLPLCYVHSKNPIAAEEIARTLLDYWTIVRG